MMAYKPSEGTTAAESLKHLAAVFYRKKAEEGGYLRDARIQRDSDMSGRGTRVKVTAVVVASGKELMREIDGDFTAIDQDVIGAINSMVSEAKSLCGAFEPRAAVMKETPLAAAPIQPHEKIGRRDAPGNHATPNCCDAHAQGAAAVEGCSNASDAIKRCVVCDGDGHWMSECPRTYIPQHEKCGRGKHEADGDMKIVAHPVGSYIFAEDRATRKEAGLKMCRHCRSLYVPR